MRCETNRPSGPMGPDAHDLDIVADIKNNVLEWTEHVVRMIQGRIVKVFESKPVGSRRRGRLN